MIGRKVAIFYNDLANHVTRAEGILTEISETGYVLDNKTLIPKDKVVRVELQ